MGCEMAVLFIAVHLERLFHFLTLAHLSLHTTGEGAAEPPLAFLSYLDLKTHGLSPLWGPRGNSLQRPRRGPSLDPKCVRFWHQI